MTSRIGLNAIASTVVVLASLAFFAPAANACMTCQCTNLWWCVPCDDDDTIRRPVEVNFLSAERVTIRVPGYLTTHLAIGQECVVALPDIAGVVSVNETVNFDTRTDFPLAAVSFASSDLPGPAVARVVSDLGFDAGNRAPWHSFVSTTDVALPDGEPNHFVLELRLEPDTDPHEFVKALRDHGALLTASSDRDGIPDGGHTFLKPFAGFPMQVTMPRKEIAIGGVSGE